MGCIWCAQTKTELLCLKCNNWATKEALAKHGDIIPNFKVSHVRTDDGWRDWTQSSSDPLIAVNQMIRQISTK